MRRIVIGQGSLIICCILYLIWWCRGYRPGVNASRLGGINGVLLLATAAFGIAGIALSLMPLPLTAAPKLRPTVILIAGIAGYLALVLITRFAFHRIVTTELFLIVGWTILEMTVISRLNAFGGLSGTGFAVMCAVIAAAFVLSIVLYVAYYRMEGMKAFYLAMVPLITEALAMAVLVGMLLSKGL